MRRIDKANTSANKVLINNKLFCHKEYILISRNRRYLQTKNDSFLHKLMTVTSDQ